MAKKVRSELSSNVAEEDAASILSGAVQNGKGPLWDPQKTHGFSIFLMIITPFRKTKGKINE